MLIITRRYNETILIGDNSEIRIQVLGVERDRVKLGILAPLDTPILRAELHERPLGRRALGRLLDDVEGFKP